jgi:hypothetical protein
MMEGSALLLLAMIVMMVVMCGGLFLGIGRAFRRRQHRQP